MAARLEAGGPLRLAGLDDSDIRGGTQKIVTLGTNWYWNPYVKLRFNYERAAIDLSRNEGDGSTPQLSGPVRVRLLTLMRLDRRPGMRPWSHWSGFARLLAFPDDRRHLGGALMGRLTRPTLLVGIALLTAACATSEEWDDWYNNKSHFASGKHMTFSLANQGDQKRVTRADVEAARAESWWGRPITVSADQIIER